MAYDADLSIKDETGYTALHYITINVNTNNPKKQYDAIEKLLMYYNNVNIPNNVNSTPLTIAVLNHRDIIVEILLRYDADPYITDDYNNDAFYYANEYPNNRILNIFQEFYP